MIFEGDKVEKNTLIKNLTINYWFSVEQKLTFCDIVKKKNSQYIKEIDSLL